MYLNLKKSQNVEPNVHPKVVEDLVRAVKLLGFKINQKLTWGKHVQQVDKRLSRVVFLLRKLKNHVTEQYLVPAYHALFHNHVSYDKIIWTQATSYNKS